MAAAAPIVELRQATKTFGDQDAVTALSMAIAPGQVFGLIGPSGSGKTTTIRLLVGVLKPTSGEVFVMGKDPLQLAVDERARIGYMPQSFELYPSSTVHENLSFVAGLYGLGWWARRRPLRRALEFVELWDVRNRLAGRLSGGMKRRLQLAAALVHDPQLIFVDEPTAGLDPLLRAKIWDFLHELRDRGKTIFVTTQLIEETQRCDNVAVMAHSRLVALGSPQALRRKALGGEMVDIQSGPLAPATLSHLRELPQVKAVRWNDDGGLRVVVEDAATATPAITESLQHDGEVVEAVRPVVPSFDEVFRHIVGADRDGNG
ncbi:MAG TPA: ABC transporter ATP-binding protein [Chloroflexota bacterium]|jgi:ABC-2 type transport system ATP-binding protein|nr:ABC transporter ATP-binding protein [Chloroflexota bacterium]